MTEAYICDYIRTPIGRFGGALASVRADDLGAVPLKALMRAQPGSTGPAVDDVIYRLRQPGGRGQSQRRAHGAAAGGLPVERARRHRQPPVRLGHGRASIIAARAIKAGEAELMIAGGVESMTRAPFVMPKAETRLLPQRRDLRHHDRLALRQSADEGSNTASTPCRRPARTSPRTSSVSREDQDAFALRSQTRPWRRRKRAAAPGDRAGDDPAAQGGPDRRRQGRASARRDDHRGAGQAADAVPRRAAR